jgi:aryl-alcohol dehydrogenase-like predicted oxidoreductase
MLASICSTRLTSIPTAHRKKSSAQRLKGRRDDVLISTKTSLPMGDGPNDAGSSRFRLIRAVENALRRLGTDYIDLLQLHAFDAATPVEEVLSTLDTLVQAGKLRYIGVSKFLRLADYEVAVRCRQIWLAALCRQSGLLLARRS